MKNFISVLAFGLLTATASVSASPAANYLEERYKASLNEMVQKVTNTPDAEAKREVLSQFIVHMRDGIAKAEGIESLSAEDRITLHALGANFITYHNELNGQGGFDRVANADLNGFAGYIKQGMEQAPSGGGVYLSGGALLLIIILLIILL